MSVRLAAAIVTTCLCGNALAQTPAPNLTRPQRDLLQAIVTAVDAAPAQPESADLKWQHHVMRASDGSHYIAFSVTPAAASLAGRIMLYVRLAPARTAGITETPLRSVVREWLLGARSDPRLLPQRRGFAVGEMPAMGAGTIGARGATSVGSADLQIMELQRERARQRKADEEKQRRSALESGETDSALLPFEDFDLVVPATLPDGARAIQRALTSGPGAYDLFVAWADASQRAPAAAMHVVRRSIVLGPAGTGELALGSIIIADRIGVRSAPRDPIEQRAHPYTIGLTEIDPASDSIFTPDDQLSVAFQIVNPMAAATGKPDVQVALRIVRFAGIREEQVAALSPLKYDGTTLPADFDLRAGHPIIAAMSASLATIPRGRYRLQIAAEDRIAATVAAAAVDFTVIGSLASLLAEAPPLGRPFQPEAALRQPILNEVLNRLTPPAPSAALTDALQSARAGRFADLLVVTAVPEGEQPVRTALSGLALLSLGNPAAVTEFQRALALQASAFAHERPGELRRDGPEAAIHFLMAAARALQRRDGEAAAAWEAARAAGLPAALVDGLLAEAYLRQKDFARAATAIGSRPADDDRDGMRVFAATRIATGRHAEAIDALDVLLRTGGGDRDAEWLRLHALYADFVRGNHDRRERLLLEAPRYIDAKGANAALAEEWLARVISS